MSNVVAGFLDHALLAVHRAAPPADIVCGLLDLLFPCHAEQPVHAMLCEHEVNRRQERRFISDLPFAPTSRRRQSRKFGLRMAQPFFQPRGLLVGMHGGAHHQDPFRPCRCVPGLVRRLTGPLTLLSTRT
jgi:hypothetical protein